MAAAFAPRPIAKIESRVVFVLLSALTLFALFRADLIFETYPTCPDIGPCETELVYVGPGAPPLRFDWEAWEFTVPWTPEQYAPLPLDQSGLEGALFDPMMASGFMAAFVAIWLSLPMDRLFAQMANQLVRDRVLDWSAADFHAIETMRLRLAHGTAAVVFVLMVVGYGLFYDFDFRGTTLEFFLGSVLLGAIAGHRLGSAGGYGMFARRLRRTGAALHLFAGHSDKIGGSRRLGEFLAYQCILCSVPIIWLSIWLYLEIQRTDLYPQYAGWILLHAALMAVALTLFWLAFLRPFLVVTRKYRAARAALGARYSERLRQPLDRARETYFNAETWSEERDAYARLSQITSIHDYVDAMPSLPIRTVVGGAFSISALFPLITLITGLLVEKGTGLAEAMGVLTGLIKALGLS